MKPLSTPWFILYGLVFVFLFFALGACAATQGPASQIDSFLKVALADNVLSKEELEQLVKLIQSLADHESSQIDWPTFLGGLAGSAVSTVLGVNLYRNKTRAKALEGVRVEAQA